MNKKHMVCSYENRQLKITYSAGSVALVSINDLSGEIIFHMRSGVKKHLDVTSILFPDVGYLKQFGISLTYDAKYFFIQSWELGLYCFELETGFLMWHYKQKQAYDLVIRKNTVICRFLDKGIKVLDIQSGKQLINYPLGYDKVFLPITDDFYLVGPQRGKYHIIDGDTRRVYSIPYKFMNPHLFDNFIINDVSFVTGGIEIEGFEYYLKDFMDVMKCKPRDNRIDMYRYSRFVTLDCSEN